MKILSETPVGNHGFVRLIGLFGDDATVCESARLSYGEGTRRVSDDRNLIRYLMKHRHTSPFEQNEVRYHLKVPIFVMRQLVRHRMASLNEMSGRYSVLPTEFYMPPSLKAQSDKNKQGSMEVEHEKSTEFLQHFADVQKIASTYYNEMIDANVSRELARCLLPVNLYTECIWKCDLHNLFHFLKLRTDLHAQAEIREFANIMEDLTRPHFPLSFEAYDDYLKNAVLFSAMELRVMGDALGGRPVQDREHYGMSDREWKEFHIRFPALSNA